MQNQVENVTFITHGAELRAKYLPSQSSRKDQTYLDYIQILKKQGIQINPKLFPSFFKLKNGLQYPGVATRQYVFENQILVRVPQKLILNSFKASQRQQLKQIFQQDFYHDQYSYEDRILCTYLLFIYGKKQQNNIWYHMVKYLSKDIDILGFWSEKDLNKFRDLTVKSAAEQDKQSFQEEWTEFMKIQTKYEILQDPVFTKDNYCWIFIHLASRCFGKSIQFTSMAPFCEFINHHCCNGYYDIQKLSKQEKQQQTQKQTKQLQQNEKQQYFDDNKSQLTSQGSYHSQDYIQVGQFAYDQINSIPFKWNSNESYDLNSKEKLLIQELKKKNLSVLQNQLKWDDFTILFVPYMIQMCNLVQNQYIAGRKIFQKAYNDLSVLSQCINYYKLKICQVYKKWKHKNYSDLLKTPQIKKPDPLPKRLQFPSQQKIKYDNFILTTGKKDNFKPNNQVYFCYGRNSNRTLLLRYGFAIQGNKYEHVWLSFQIIEILSQFSDTLIKLQQKGLSLRRKFKIKYGRLNMELIMFFRLNSWSFYGKKSVEQLFEVTQYYKQIAILNQIKDQLEYRLQLYQDQQQQQRNLQDKNLSYHDYFIIIYHQQKQKILKQHIQFMNNLIKFNQSLQNGQKIENLKKKYNQKEKYTYRHYLQQFK